MVGGELKSQGFCSYSSLVTSHSPLLSGRYLFCCTFRTRSRLAPVTSPPRYGAHHPVEFGLSSRPACKRLSRRPSDLLRRHYSCAGFDSKAEHRSGSAISLGEFFRFERPRAQIRNVDGEFERWVRLPVFRSDDRMMWLRCPRHFLGRRL